MDAGTAAYIALWVLVAAMLLLGLVGVILPAIPGTILVFGGVLLGAWIDDFTRISTTTVVIAGVLAVIAWVADYVSAMLGAKRAGASKTAVVGAAIGTVVGLFFGLVGLLFFPLIGAAIGEYLAISDLRRAGNVGVATWIGMLIGTVVKVVLTFFTIGIFLVALIF
ncbi:MAG: DUF456 domain-containing protein [Burkholderiaceae bacterium]